MGNWIAFNETVFYLPKSAYIAVSTAGKSIRDFLLHTHTWIGSSYTLTPFLETTEPVAQTSWPEERNGAGFLGFSLSSPPSCRERAIRKTKQTWPTQLKSFLLSALTSSLSNQERVIYLIWTSAPSSSTEEVWSWFSLLWSLQSWQSVKLVTGTQRHSLVVVRWSVPGDL